VGKIIGLSFFAVYFLFMLICPEKVTTFKGDKLRLFVCRIIAIIMLALIITLLIVMSVEMI